MTLNREDERFTSSTLQFRFDITENVRIDSFVWYTEDEELILSDFRYSDKVCGLVRVDSDKTH